MKKATFIKKTEEAQNRVNNRNAKRFLDKLVEKFNNSQNQYEADFVGEVHNFAWVETQIRNIETQKTETIRINLP